MKILIIEDDERVANLIRRGFEEQDFSISVAYDGLLGKKLALDIDFDLIIMDLILPKINGIDLCKEIRSERPQIPIIMLTALGTTDDKIVGFDAGADDYLVKPFDFRELQVRVRALIQRKTRVEKDRELFLRFEDIEVNLQTKNVTRAGVKIPLTPKELKLLEYMMQNNGRILSRTEIAEKVWDTHFDTGTNFIDVYINYLRNKIDKNFPVKLIYTRPGLGFILKNENDN